MSEPCEHITARMPSGRIVCLTCGKEFRVVLEEVPE